MTTRHPLFLILLLSAGLMLGACGKKSPDDSKVLASVNGESITEKDYEDYLRARQAQQPPIPDKDKEKKVVLDEMVNRVLLVHSAIDQKVDQELDVYFQIKRQRENVLARAMLRKYLKDNPISDEEVQKRFEQEMRKGQQERVSRASHPGAHRRGSKGNHRPAQERRELQCPRPEEIHRRAFRQAGRRPRLVQPGRDRAGILQRRGRHEEG